MAEEENNQQKSSDFEVIKEGEDVILKIDYEQNLNIPSLEDDQTCMASTVEKLINAGAVTKIIFLQKRDYEYDYSQTQLLVEIAELYKRLIKEGYLQFFQSLLSDAYSVRVMNTALTKFQEIFYRRFKGDPAGTYIELKRLSRQEKLRLKGVTDERLLEAYKKFLKLIDYVSDALEKTKLIQALSPYLAGAVAGDRGIYKNLFSATTKPDFMYTRLMSAYPPNGEEVGAYNVGDSEVTIFKFPDSVKNLYHIFPPEFKLSEEKYEILDMARNILAEHKPSKEEFVNPERMRGVFQKVGIDLVDELAASKNYGFSQDEIKEIVEILVRYTVGFGLIEVLLADEKVQDISVNSPMGQTPMFIVHQDFGDCYTNIYPTKTESESWATKLRLMSGRPLDEANPILDTEIILPVASSRVSTITSPLNPTGLAFSFRRHRDEPWTLPLFMKVRMIDPLAAGLLSFLIDGTRTMLVCGTRSSGKTSFLGSFLVEIMRRYRIITIEDTLELPGNALIKQGYNLQQMKVAGALAKEGSAEVTATDGIRATLRLGDSALFIGEVRSSLRGDEEVVVVENGLTKRVSIKNLEAKNLSSFSVPTLDGEQKMKLKKLTGFVKHPKRTELIKITTKSGRQVIVTPDHSVFTHINFKIAAINTNQLNEGDSIIVPSKIPCGFNDLNFINLLDIFKDDYRLEGAEPYIRKAIKTLGWKKANKICGVADIYRYLLLTQKTRIPINSFLKLMHDAKVKYDISDLKIKRGTSNTIPAKFPINENIMRLLGYYLAEGNNDNKKIQITNSKPEIIKDIIQICQKEFGLKPYVRKIFGLGSSVQMIINSKPLVDLFKYWDCGKTSVYKKIPDFIYGLDQKKICALLKGMYSGDGSISITKRSGTMIRYFTTSKRLIKDVAYALLTVGIVCRLHDRKLESGKTFYIAEIKQRKYVEQFLHKIGFTHKNPKIITKAFPHSVDDSVSFNVQELEKHLKLPRRYRHLRKTRCCSKDYLKRITEEVKCSDEIYNFAHGDFFIDKVKSLELIKLKKPEYVYDLSVKSTERFIGGFGGILLHNTEAIALYEAMRVGAAANVVAGTIHAESPYGVFDRVVNDIGVPKTSFKATDLIVVANPIRSASGTKRVRRITQITEVRKHWEKDPLLEGGFVDLMKYNVETDKLEPTQDLINGDSELLKAVAGNIKGLAGNWDAVWDNIMLRAKIKQTLVEYSDKLKDPKMLEAHFVILANDMYHNIVEEVQQDVGSLDSGRIFFEWEEWLKREVKKRGHKHK